LIQILPAHINHIAQILPNLRTDDYNEIYAATGEKDPTKELYRALQRDGSHYTAFLPNGEVLAIFGIAETQSFTKIGSPWLVASNAVADHEVAFLRKSKIFFPKLIKNYDYLINMVDERNLNSKQWLQWLGFQIHPATPYGPFDQNFHKFDLCQIPQQQSIPSYN
jgi:hypothetical protein